MAGNNRSVKKSLPAWGGFDRLADEVRDVNPLYDEWFNGNYQNSTEQESRLYNEIDEMIDELADKVSAYHNVLLELTSTYEASARKSKYAQLHKKLNKIGGFVKDDDETEIDIKDDDVVEIEGEDGDKKVEIESKEKHEEEVADGEESADDNLNEFVKGCDGKSKKTVKGMKTSKKQVKMKKGEDMPEDADDQQDQNEKGSGNAGSELPEDADENQEINEKGEGSAGDELPEDADEQENIKESARKARLARMQRASNKSARKGVRKFSVTPGGQPNQESYNGRYQQSPMVRNAIDGHFGGATAKSYDEVGMLQDRLDALNKSKRNAKNNNVPQKLR